MDFSNLTGPVLDNTIAALIGMFLISAATWAYRKTRDTMNERKYSIGGHYRATYEDVLEDGSIFYEKANVHIKQKGLKIHAEDTDAATGKDWILDGEIDPITGEISGRYTTKSKHDTGLGVCILKQKKNGILEGLWAGYDEENIDKLESGKYTLIKRINVKIRKAARSDLVSVLQLLDQELGEDWIHLEDLKQAVRDDFLYVADFEGRIAGFTLLRMLDMAAFKKELKTQKYKIPRDVEVAADRGKLGFIEAIATDPDFQKRGIGSKLIQQSLDTLQSAGAEMVCAMGWKTDHVHIGPAMEIFNFKARATFEKFWYEESLADPNPAACPCPGAPPCTCGVVFFTKALNYTMK